MKDQSAPFVVEDGDDGDDDRTYFRQRAAWHVRRAAITGDLSARTLHERFADMYTRRALSRTST